MEQNIFSLLKIRSISNKQAWAFFLFLGFAGFGFFLFENCLAVSSPSHSPESIPEEVSASIPSYQARFGRKRPVIAVVGDNEYTELTDFVVPYGTLKEANLADVYALGTQIGSMRMFPALSIQIQNTMKSFDSQYPEGADYVIVPAMHNSKNAEILLWLKAQKEKGATIVGVCDGVWVLANAGLLQDHKATGHWFSLSKLEKEFPETKWIRNRRYISDRKIITTTGVTASIPVSLALIEAISGTERAAKVASSLGAKDWKPTHRSADFYLGSSHIYTAAKNLLSFWSQDEIGVPISEGIDEISLALVADSYSRTYKSEAVSISDSDRIIRSKRGLLFLPDRKEKKADRISENWDKDLPVYALNRTLSEISDLYGTKTAAFVALQIEYPWGNP
ncbi:transcriptional regulator [Leptospira langatensis]|uniref:Transcriptional regulator n=1 Tax=Leptospira langatensis TaxID=2484983 RepID=A0A5F1ZXF7_9LEPT|nr:DJ-1/PfpI family protein [Leptospira langatensis]TGK01280.1 transcriptional regulator [Leptospira langatensis]TGL42267.1 transcriptional regulator [Leptospira langatensis]